MLRSLDAFAILPPDVVLVAQVKVKESEMTNPYRSRSYSSWMCGHCSAPSEKLESYEIVVAHLKSVYVSSFTFNYPSFLPIHCYSLFIYFIYQLRDWRASRAVRSIPLRTKPVSRYLIDAPVWTLKTIRCLQCANVKPSEQNRLFDINGVKIHLRVGARKQFTWTEGDVAD